MVNINLNTHISGLASGMDTESIVNNMMKVNRIPLDKLMQAKTINTWKTDAYREINTKIASFRDAMQDLRLSGTFSMQKATSSDSRIDVSMAGTSTQTGFKITEAKQATSAKSGSVSFDTKIVNGSNKIDPTGMAVNFEFTLNGTPISIPNDSTYDQAIAKINSFSQQTGVKASNVGGSLVFTTTSTNAGAEKSISITNANPEARGFLQITDGDTKTGTGFAPGTYTDGAGDVPGYVIINGTKINISSNTFTFDGVQINLKQDILDGQPAAISIGSDTDKIFDKIKTFVDKYNELIKDLNDKLAEPKNRKYPPLTDAQKKDMKDDEIKLWEDKAKSGMLANDPTIRQFLTQLRTSLSETVKATGIDTSFDSLNKIGISPSKDYRDNGKLVLDESKLKSLLTSNLSDIQKMFSSKFDTGVASDTTVTNSTKYNNSGFGTRVYDRINDVLSKLKVIAGAPGIVSSKSDLAKEAANIDDRISKLQIRLNSQEQSLWAKFNAMESALQKLNSQSSWLTQQLGQ